MTLSLAGLVVLALWTYVCGRTLTRRLRYDGVAEEVSFSVAVGLGALGSLLGLLGMAGYLDTPHTLLALALVSLACGRTWKELGRLRTAVPRGVWLLAAPLLASFVLGLYPPTAFDETLYHLPYARAFASAHALPFLTDLRFPIFPQLVEAIFAALFAAGGDTLTHVVEWLAAAMAALGLLAAGQRLGSERAGLLAAAVWLGNPLVLHLAGASYVDLSVTAFGGLACLAFAVFVRTRAVGFLVLSASLAGFAASSKYLGLLVVVGLLAATTFVALRRRLWRAPLVFASVAFLIAAPWYVRIARATGNPVFPFLSGVFGSSAWDGSDDPVIALGSGRSLVQLLGLAGEHVFDLARHPQAVVLLPWRAAFDRGGFGHQAPLSPVYVFVVPWLVVAAIRDVRARLLLLGSVAYLTLGTSLDLRYLLPLAFLFALAGGLAIDRVLLRWRASAGWMAPAVAAVLLAPGVAYAGYRIAQQGPVPTHARAREAYLERRLGEAYAAIASLNESRGRAYTVYALHAENLRYFAEGRFIGDWSGPARYGRVLPALGDSRSLYRILRELGADHLLVNRAVAPLPLPEDDFFRAHFRALRRSTDVALFEIVNGD